MIAKIEMPTAIEDLDGIVQFGGRDTPTLTSTHNLIGGIGAAM